MPAWFDLKSLDPNGEEDASGIKKSADLVESLIKAEIDAGIAPKNIVIGGFSQGGALALYTGKDLRVVVRKQASFGDVEFMVRFLA